MRMAEYMQGDLVIYVADKFRQELSGKVGIVHAAVERADDTYIIEFPETKEGDSYVMNAKSLRPFVASDKAPGPPVSQRRRKKDKDLDETDKEVK